MLNKAKEIYQKLNINWLANNGLIKLGRFEFTEGF